MIFALVAYTHAEAPAWWGQRGLYAEGAIPDDFSVANQGQLKNMAVNARDEFNVILPGGAGPQIDQMVNAWLTYTPGLHGEYFNNMTLSGTPVLVRDEAVNFDWGKGSPSDSVNPEKFSARWTGMFVPTTANDFKFQTLSDDGVRLWVDDKLVIDNWTAHAVVKNESPFIAYKAGKKYKIRLEYFERGGYAVMKLLATAPKVETANYGYWRPSGFGANNIPIWTSPVMPFPTSINGNVFTIYTGGLTPGIYRYEDSNVGMFELVLPQIAVTNGVFSYGAETEKYLFKLTIPGNGFQSGLAIIISSSTSWTPTTTFLFPGNYHYETSFFGSVWFYVDQTITDPSFPISHFVNSDRSLNTTYVTAGDPLPVPISNLMYRQGDDYTAINLGQLKAVAKPFYDRLITLGIRDTYPWAFSPTPPDNFAVANIGQVKFLFSFSAPPPPLTPPTPETDKDGNGIADDWERFYYHTTGIDPNGDTDQDGLTAIEEYLLGTNPTLANVMVSPGALSLGLLTPLE